MSILFWSDLHADAVTMGVRRHTELERVCDVVESTAISANVDTVIFGGDLADPEPEGWACLARIIEMDRRLHAAGKQVLWMTGNHDVIEDGRGSSTLSPLIGCGAAVVRTAVLVDTADGKIGFLPFTPRALAYNPAGVVEEWGKGTVQDAPQIIFGHLNLKDAVPGSETHDMPRGRDVQWPLDALKQWLPSARLFGGHYHGASDINGVTIVGSPALFTFGEENNVPQVLIIDNEGHRSVPIQPHARFRTLQYDVDTDRLHYQGKHLTRSTVVEKLMLMAFVRVQASRDSSGLVQLEQRLKDAGALAVRVEVGASDVQPAATDDATPMVTVSDGLTEAQRLAAEWATADPELKAAIATLVKEVGEECSS